MADDIAIHPSVSPPSEHWSQMPPHWDQVGAPLRPGPEDIGLFHQLVQRWDGNHRQPRVLLLGVTPEIYRMGWPEGTDFLAVDRAQAMIEHVWPGPPEATLQSDWLEMDLPPASRDILFCDGGLNLLAFPDQYQRLAGLLAQILAPGGICIFRLFVPPKERESVEAVLDDLVTGKVPNLNVLKMRLWSALQDNVLDGIELAEVWRTLHRAVGDLAAFAPTIGWSPEHILAIDAYRDSPARYHLPTAGDLLAIFCAGGAFRVSAFETPSYTLAERCPIVALTRS